MPLPCYASLLVAFARCSGASPRDALALLTMLCYAIALPIPSLLRRCIASLCIAIALPVHAMPFAARRRAPPSCCVAGVCLATPWLCFACHSCAVALRCCPFPLPGCGPLCCAFAALSSHHFATPWPGCPELRRCDAVPGIALLCPRCSLLGCASARRRPAYLCPCRAMPSRAVAMR